jgi:phosphate starvation-inducible PhoH-like protein
VARHLARNAKRSNKPNPREERNSPEFSRSNRRGRDNVVDFEDAAKNSQRRKRVELIPRNLAQEIYVDQLFDEQKAIVFAMGPAGCGKTLLATLYAIKCLQSGETAKIVITRPAVSVDEQHGFLPGTLVDKMAPWVIPIMDVFKEYYSPQQILKMVEEEIIEIAPLAYMRGRTMKNCIVIADEMQNSTVSQTKMVLTRIGENCRMIVTGDLKQHDRGYETNGLGDFTNRLSQAGSKKIAVVNFDAGDVERHPVIEEVLALYGDE